MAQQGFFHRFIERVDHWKVVYRFGLSFIAISLLFILITSFVTRTRAHTAAAQIPPAHSNPSNGDKQPLPSETPAVLSNLSGDQGIPLPTIAERAEGLEHLLREISSQLTPKSELLESERKTAEQAEEIRKRSLQTRQLLAGAPTPLELEDELRYWRSRNLEYGEERKLLTLRAAKLEGQIQTLEAQKPEWTATWIHIRESPGIESVVERTKQLLNRIQGAISQSQEQLSVVITLQNEVSQQDQQISDILLLIREAREGERARLFETDSPPLWEAHRLRRMDQAAGFAFRPSFNRTFTTAWEFLWSHTLAVLTIISFYFVALLGVYKLSHYVSRKTAQDVSVEAAHVLNRPYSVALMLTLIGAGKFMSSAPIGIAFIFYLLYMIPILRVLAPLVDLRLRVFLSVLAGLFSLEGVFLLVQLPAFLRRELYALLILIALISLGWFALRSKILQAAPESRSQRVFVFGVRGILALLAASLVCNTIGFVSLSQVLGMTALVGPFASLALYCGARVLTLVLGVVLRTHWVRTLVDPHVDAIERWGSSLLALGAFLLWLRSMLKLVTIYDAVAEAASNLFRYPIGFQRIHFTLGDALGVPFILLSGYFAAHAFTFLLKKVVLPKLPLKRGLPYAISTVTYYVLLVIVALAGLSSSGIELNKFTVLTGALGVGLGFGLQNIVNNFVSGLILLFERPIHVGDTVDVGGLVGTVRRIGARSSTVVTFQGAEVIVPNSNLLSNQVINWTLSSQWRRVDVPIRVAYGNDPEAVIKLLVGVAESHPGVLMQRPPAAFFMGFGESSLNFELRFWSGWQDTWFQLQSDVTVAVAKALREAGMEIPFPQRDLHIRSVDRSAAEALTDNGARLVSSSDRAARPPVR